MAFKSKAKKAREAALSEKVKELGQEIQRLSQLLGAAKKEHASAEQVRARLLVECRRECRRELDEEWQKVERERQSYVDALKSALSERDHYREKFREVLGVMEDAREMATR
jgi:uncharacterized coiled-coil DUF342 family protein